MCSQLLSEIFLFTYNEHGCGVVSQGQLESGALKILTTEFILIHALFLMLITILKSFLGFQKFSFGFFFFLLLTLAELLNLGSINFNMKIDSATCMNIDVFC